VVGWRRCVNGWLACWLAGWTVKGGGGPPEDDYFDGSMRMLCGVTMRVHFFGFVFVSVSVYSVHLRGSIQTGVGRAR
jgi:hypothetical protein